MTTDRIDDRLRRMPVIRRARGYRLYAPGGARFLDLYQDGGRAILGHRGGRVLREIGSVLDRGVAAPFPSSEERRLARAVVSLLSASSIEADPARVRVYRTFDRALEAAALAAGSGAGPLPEPRCLCDDPVLPLSPAGAIACLWRPFLPDDAAARAAGSPALLPVLPVPSLFGLQVVVGLAVDLPASDLLPEPALRGATSAAWALSHAPSRAAATLPGFVSVGPYLVPDRSFTAWDDFDRVYDDFLDRGIVVNPNPAGPSIMPAECSEGEAARLRESARLALSPEGRPAGEERAHG